MSKDEKKPKTKKTEEKAKTATKAKTAKTTKAKTAKTTKAAKATKEPKETTKVKEPTEVKAPAEVKAPVKTKAENTVFVGNKPAMVYCMAIMTCFNENKAKEVKICARGRAISVAVDVAELTRNRFMQDLKVKKITTSTEQVKRRESDGVANVSAIEIILSK
ncbi:MAG: DNA-binding protein Alba [Asgard group archaeon]|nr:DNA-binding protein Alba [Asgard group archaeon]